jgi:hypothetical protein
MIVEQITHEVLAERQAHQVSRAIAGGSGQPPTVDDAIADLDRELAEPLFRAVTPEDRFLAEVSQSLGLRRKDRR